MPVLTMDAERHPHHAIRDLSDLRIGTVMEAGEDRAPPEKGCIVCSQNEKQTFHTLCG